MDRRGLWLGAGVVVAAVLALWLWPSGPQGAGGVLAPDAQAPSGRRPASAAARRASQSPPRSSPAPAGAPNADDAEQAEPLPVMEALEDDLAEREAALRAELAQWEEAGVVHAVCAVAPALPVAEGYLTVGDPNAFNGRRVLILDGEAHLPLLQGLPGEGHLAVEGYAASAVTWTLAEEGPGHCAPEPVALRDNPTTIVGAVTLDGPGGPAVGAWVEGCGNLGRVDDEGVYTLEALPGECTVLAMRQDGRFRALSEPQAVTVEEGADRVVDFVLPAEPRGGLGVSLGPGPDGAVAIQDVAPGGPADTAGVRAGDALVAVDGVAVADLEGGDLLRAVGGAAGTAVDLTVLRDEEPPRVVTVTREAME